MAVAQEDLEGVGRILQHTELGADQRNIMKKLNIDPPKRVLKVNLAA
jgi:hypothetical protein